MLKVRLLLLCKEEEIVHLSARPRTWGVISASLAEPFSFTSGARSYAASPKLSYLLPSASTAQSIATKLGTMHRMDSRYMFVLFSTGNSKKSATASFLLDSYAGKARLHFRTRRANVLQFE